MGLEDKLPSGLLLTTVEKMGGYARKNSVWPATFGLACCAIEPFQAGEAGRREFLRVLPTSFSVVVGRIRSAVSLPGRSA